MGRKLMLWASAAWGAVLNLNVGEVVGLLFVFFVGIPASLVVSSLITATVIIWRLRNSNKLL